MKTKSMEEIEQKMAGLEPESLRYHVLQAVKRFKGNWLELGRYVNLVQQSGAFKEWGFPTFQGYCTRELKLREQTVLKLMRSYIFLEKEESSFLTAALENKTGGSDLPDYESVNILRQARSRQAVSDDDYEKLRAAVFDQEVEPRELGRRYRSLLQVAREAQSDPEEAWERRRRETVKKVLGSLRAIRATLEDSRFLTQRIVDKLKQLIQEIESEAEKEG